MLSPIKFRTALAGMTSVAQKVYEAVPIQETWPNSSIHTEMKRRGMSYDYSVLGGCLKTLVQAGLIKESTQGFTRVAVKQETEKMPKTTSASLPDQLGQLASSLRNVADQMDEIALEIEEQLFEHQRGQEAAGAAGCTQGGRTDMTDRTLLQQALDALRQCEFTTPPAQRKIVKDAIDTLRAALAQPAPAAPAVLQPLTDERVFADDNIMAINAELGLGMYHWMRIVRAIERAHGITGDSNG